MKSKLYIYGRTISLKCKDPLAPDDLFLGNSLQAFYAFTEPMIRRYVEPKDRLLDIGCGDAALSLRLLQSVPLESLIGVDIREKAIKMAKHMNSHGNGEFFESDAQDLEWLATLGKFDVILARTSAHHFLDPIGTLQGYVDLLQDSGRIILIDIDRESACYSVFGFPLTLMITWMTVIKTLGWKNGWRSIRGMKYPSKAWRLHRAVDVAHRKKIGWYRFKDIKSKLQLTFPTAHIGRLASCCGLGGVHYMIYEKTPNG